MIEMKTLKLYFESLLDDDDIFLDPENDIKCWINDNYKFTGKLTISNDFVVDCNGGVGVRNTSITSLTNGLFEWGVVGGSFSCSDCKNLTSLEGAPKKVGETFYCYDCDNLTSLEGAPKRVGKTFYCYDCDNLTSLEGAPEKVGDLFDCSYCKNLTSLKGAPEKDVKRFNCSNCDKLRSLEDGPEKLKRIFAL